MNAFPATMIIIKILYLMIAQVVIMPFDLWWDPRRFKLLSEEKGIEVITKISKLHKVEGQLSRMAD